MIALNDAPDVGEPYARTLELLHPVEALEDAEELVYVSHVEPHAVVADEEVGLRFVLHAADLDHGPLARTRVFEGVREQVPED